MKDLNINRREFFTVSTLFASTFLGQQGCAFSNKYTLEGDVSSKSFKVDIHCHIFNAKDIDALRFVERFIDRINKSFDPLKPILTSLAILILSPAVLRARTAEKELEFLEAKELGLPETEAQFDKEDYKNLVADKIIEDLKNLESSESKINWNELIKFDEKLNFKSELQEFQKNVEENEFSSKYRFIGLQILDKILGTPFAELFNFAFIASQNRSTNAKELIRTYNKEKTNFRLFVPEMVDFDLWIKSDCKEGPGITEEAGFPETNYDLGNQIKLMSKISILNNGMILPMIPYDPLRDLKNEQGQINSGLNIVKLAIKKYGFVGVKVYPANGFYPTGNKNINASDLCQKNGKELDKKLDVFYKWCSDHDVPIMAHCNKSMGTLKKFDDRGNPIHWEGVFKKWPKLRVNLGHFGGFNGIYELNDFDAINDLNDEKINKNNWPVTILKMMQKYPNFYSDLALFDEFIKPSIGLFNLCKLFSYNSKIDKYFSNLREARKILLKNNIHLENRLMYGSDWFMLAKERGNKKYFKEFYRVFNEHFSFNMENIFGGNAIRYLGLNKNLKTAKNTPIEYLAEFYKSNKIIPSWLKFLDDNSLLKRIIH
jgi:predicted TIM-barrel fold metal-dependent hydrolase